MEHQLQAASPSAVRVRNDLTGQRFGKLTVLEYVKIKNGNSKWKCRCDCGSITYKITGHLNAGTVSCGCSQVKDLVGKQRSGNSSQTGVRGVILKDGKYLAQINYKKKRYYLGRYFKLEDAVKARKQAETRIEEYVEAYHSGIPLPEEFSL